ncbi:MAG: sigma factor-like helix-turn-helix DNA-binding protein [Mycobacteriales bacterium]
MSRASQGRHHAEVAAALHCSEATVRSQASRALQRLRELTVDGAAFPPRPNSERNDR